MPWIEPRYVTWVTRSISSGVQFHSSASTAVMATLTQTSISPSVSSISRAAASTASASATSAGATQARRPASRTSAAAASRRSRPRAISPTSAPRAANSRTQARPMPADAPVMTTTFPSRLMLGFCPRRARLTRAAHHPHGVRRHHPSGWDRRAAMQGRRFQMHEKLVSIGDDAWIEDDEGERVYKVDGKAMRIRDTFVLEDRDGNEVARIQERKLRVRDTMAIERDGRKVATVHKALVGFRARFKIEVEDGEDLRAHGNILDHEYEIERDGDTVASVSKKWFRIRDTYGVEVRGGEDEALMLALTVALDEMTGG